MGSILKNEAAWITAAKTRPLKVGPGLDPNPSENEVVIKVAYAAVNPTDWKVRKKMLLCGRHQNLTNAIPDARHSIF